MKQKIRTMAAGYILTSNGKLDLRVTQYVGRELWLYLGLVGPYQRAYNKKTCWLTSHMSSVDFFNLSERLTERVEKKRTNQVTTSSACRKREYE
ncbi:hypothetical protein J6590_061455 [Homalodisca vitripennis]|nr:hypothetical protein J6590_061455 [Homalodisca vitripennis]